jgi:CheY-like chemotaxis protein
MSVIGTIGLAAAERLERSVGPAVALRSYKALLTDEEHSIVTRATLGAIRCALAIGDALELDGPPSESAEVPQESVPFTKLRLLLVEDGLVNQRVAVGLLEQRGHAVIVASNGREALERLAEAGEGTFDAVLMDVQMPEMDGFEATAAIREGERNGARHMPVIAMTAHAMKGDRERCLAAGMDDYVSKPLRPEILYETIERNANNEDAPIDPNA